MCHLSHVKKIKIKNVKKKISFFFTLKKLENLVKLVGGGSVINGAYPV